MKFVCAVLFLLPGICLAQSDAATLARDAMTRLQAATQKLDAAEGARDRVAALTETISAYEQGLAALRDSLRRAYLRELDLSARVQAQDAEIAALLAALQHMGNKHAPIALLHPAGPAGTARAGMLLAEVTPALNEAALSVRQDLTDIQMLRALEQQAAERLRAGLQEVQNARVELSEAIADRGELPRRFTNDPVREAILIASTDTLAQFAKGLDRVAVDQTDVAVQSHDVSGGGLPLPAQGRVLAASDLEEAEQSESPGIFMTVAPRALVTTPVPATIRYAGPLLDMGQIVILEPQVDVLFVFAGLDTVYVRAGEIVDTGMPVGLMGGKVTKTEPGMSIDGEDTGAGLTETLYIEVRQNNLPEDPSLWFRIDRNG